MTPRSWLRSSWTERLRDDVVVISDSQYQSWLTVDLIDSHGAWNYESHDTHLIECPYCLHTFVKVIP